MKSVITRYGWGMLVLLIAAAIIYYKIKTMKKVKESATNSNVRAFLLMIQKSEGTLGPNAYRMLFGGGLFDSYAKHPNILVRKSGYSSTAAGAYQFLFRTWQELAVTLNLSDFSPANQDLGAIELIRQRGALDDVIAGNFDTAVQKVSKVWASLPGAGYGQPERSITSLRTFYTQNGGQIA